MTERLKFNLSPSSWNLYKKSQLQFYYQYILKAQPDTNVVQCYGKFGSAVHELLELYPKYTTAEDFEKFWKKYNLDTLKGLNGKIMKQSDFLNSILRGINLLKTKYTSAVPEEIIVFPLIDDERAIINTKGIIDVKDIKNDKKYIADWKTSSKESDEFRLQGMFYAYLVYRKYGVVVNEVIFEYLKINKEKKYTFDKEDFEKLEKDIKTTAEEIISKGMDISKYELGEYNDIFNQHLKKCKAEEDRRKHIHNKEIKFKLHIDNGRIYIKNELSNMLIQGLIKTFSYELQGAFFIKKQCKWDAIKHLYHKSTKSVSLGFISKLKKVLQDYCKYKNVKCIIEIEDLRDKPLKHFMVEKLLNKDLRPEQEEAVNAIVENKVGIISACTASGKTVIAAETIRKLELKTLFIVDTIDLLHQSIEVFREELGMEVGQIGGGKKDLGNIVTVATYQTLAKNIKEFKYFLESQQLVIVDECQIAASDSILKVIRACKSRLYAIGLSATPWRNDGNDMLIESELGNVIYELKTSDAQDKGYLVNAKIKFYRMNPLYLDRNWREDYNINVESNVERNAIIAKEAIEFKEKGQSCIILTKLVDHGRVLQELIPGSIHIHGSTNKDLRKHNWEEMRKGKEGMVIITTNKIATKGLNIPVLTAIINGACDGNDQAGIQALGRVLRTYMDKNEGIYIDFLDSGKFTKKWSKIRFLALKSQGHNIEVVE